MNIFESNSLQLGERATEKAHRKIELQSPADLTYLIANVSRAARQKLDKHLPPDAAPEGEDALRRRVEQLVEDYIRQTFQVAKDGLSINGMDSREMEAELAKAQEGEEIEPFDTRLAQRIQNLSSQIENHTLQLANLRRTAPKETSEQFQESFTKQREEEEAQIRKDEQSRLETARTATVEVPKLDRMEEVQKTLQQGTASLENLKSGLGGTVARMEKAQGNVNLVTGK